MTSTEILRQAQELQSRLSKLETYVDTEKEVLHQFVNDVKKIFYDINDFEEFFNDDYFIETCNNIRDLIMVAEEKAKRIFSDSMEDMLAKEIENVDVVPTDYLVFDVKTKKFSFTTAPDSDEIILGLEAKAKIDYISEKGNHFDYDIVVKIVTIRPIFKVREKQKEKKEQLRLVVNSLLEILPEENNQTEEYEEVIEEI